MCGALGGTWPYCSFHNHLLCICFWWLFAEILRAICLSFFQGPVYLSMQIKRSCFKHHIHCLINGILRVGKYSLALCPVWGNRACSFWSWVRSSWWFSTDYCMPIEFTVGCFSRSFMKLPWYQFTLLTTHYTPRAYWANLRVLTWPSCTFPGEQSSSNFLLSWRILGFLHFALHPFTGEQSHSQLLPYLRISANEEWRRRL